MTYEPPAGLMVSVSGLRGKVGEALDPLVVTRYAAAFGTYLHEEIGGPPTVVVGRDSRTSGPLLVRSVTAALEGVGCRVIDVGLAPTPTTLMAVRHHGADGGIVVTASHNPVEWNALKLASGAGMFLDADQAAAMREHVDAPGWQRWDGIGSRETDDGAVDRHMAAIGALPYVDVDAIRERRLQGGAGLRPGRRRRDVPEAAGRPRMRGGWNQPGAGRPVPSQA